MTTTLGTGVVRGVAGVVRNVALAVLAWAVLLLAVLAVALVPLGGLGLLVLAEVADVLHRVASRQRSWAGRRLGLTLTDPAPPSAPCGSGRRSRPGTPRRGASSGGWPGRRWPAP